MNAYTDFATVYDLFMEEVPYDQWLSFLEEIWRKEGLQPEVIADLGCGTGNLLVPLTEKGYRTMGVDLSFDMLCWSRPWPCAVRRRWRRSLRTWARWWDR